MNISQSQTTHACGTKLCAFLEHLKLFLWSLKLFLWSYYLLQAVKEYLARKANEQAIELKIVVLYDHVFIQQSI